MAGDSSLGRPAWVDDTGQRVKRACGTAVLGGSGGVLPALPPLLMAFPTSTPMGGEDLLTTRQSQDGT